MSTPEDDPSQPFLYELRDGSVALIRPIEPGDKWRLAEGLQRLSLQSRWMRFHTAVKRLSEAQLRYLTEVDGANHMAWVALDPQQPERPGMAVARYIRLADEPDVAEAAITVADEYQGLGLGTILLGMLARTARSNGITVFRNYVLGENAAMLELLHQLGATQTYEANGLYRVDVPVPADFEAVPDTAGRRVFKAAAMGELMLAGPTLGATAATPDSRSEP